MVQGLPENHVHLKKIRFKMTDTNPTMDTTALPIELSRPIEKVEKKN